MTLPAALRALPRVLSVLAFVGALTMAGVHACKSGAQTASENLRDAVVTYNDALRFGRMDIAMERVSPEMRGTFAGTHYRWGRALDVAEYEIVNVEAAGAEMEHAVAYVTYHWVNRGAMLVRESLLRQEWTKNATQYYLVAETVVDGDEELLAVPEGFRPETSGLMGADRDAGVDAGPDASSPAPAP